MNLIVSPNLTHEYCNGFKCSSDNDDSKQSFLETPLFSHKVGFWKVKRFIEHIWTKRMPTRSAAGLNNNKTWGHILERNIRLGPGCLCMLKVPLVALLVWQMSPFLRRLTLTWAAAAEAHFSPETSKIASDRTWCDDYDEWCNAFQFV